MAWSPPGGALSLVPAATPPVGAAPKREAPEGMCVYGGGRGDISGGDVLLLVDMRT